MKQNLPGRSIQITAQYTDFHAEYYSIESSIPLNYTKEETRHLFDDAFLLYSDNSVKLRVFFPKEYEYTYIQNSL